MYQFSTFMQEDIINATVIYRASRPVTGGFKLFSQNYGTVIDDSTFTFFEEEHAEPIALQIALIILFDRGLNSQNNSFCLLTQAEFLLSNAKV